MNKEIRSFESTLNIERRDDAPAKIVGHAAVFNKISEKLGWFREIILPGAFDDVLENDVRALFNHDSNIVLGRTKSKTLQLRVDENGLYYEIELPDTQAARDLMISIERGDISQSSFGFSIASNGDEWKQDEEKNDLRYIKKVKRLYDISPVTFPAYPDTDAAKRSHDEYVSLQKPDLSGEKLRYETIINLKQKS